MNCEKTRTLCPSSTTSLIWGRSMSSLALGSPARVGSIRPGWQAAWRSRRSASRTSIFDRFSSAASLREQRAAVVRPELLVELALRGLHVAVEGLLRLLGKVLDDLRLGPAEDERPQRLGQERAVLDLERRGARGVPLEDGVGAEHARVEELEDRPELAQVVLDRRAAHRQAILAAEQAGGLGGLAVGVLDRLRLVEDHVVELELARARRCRCGGCRRS